MPGFVMWFVLQGTGGWFGALMLRWQRHSPGRGPYSRLSYNASGVDDRPADMARCHFATW